ncbi:ribosome maturation factor RimM [Leptospira sp. GIMC2001]|uniref:ribosome maturation factor RimM n=1 Tax=Leptospira sp. GIMC2001 TaxID=1513297 RepID=UPI002349C7B1|nr:ribosome maturation factor RimM [Leptospira sp. GIMC2001]WCL47922.1 ribosome maturation factor RimM [Leptospira sp. GIMC2001]
MEESQKLSGLSSKHLPLNTEKTPNSKFSTNTKDKNSIQIGILASSHGVKGWAKVKNAGESWSKLDFPKKIIFEKANRTKIFNILQVEIKPNYLLIRAEAVNQPEFWLEWNGAKILIEKSEADSIFDEEDGFFYYQLEGLAVLDQNGKPTGYSVEKIEESPAHDILFLKSDSGNPILVPYTKSWVGDISLGSGTIVINGWEDWIAL